MKFLQSVVKMTAAGVCLLTTVTMSNLTYAGEYQHHGTSCMTANLAQGQLFTWNKDGITNNFTTDLFVICPVTLNQDDWSGTPSIRFEVEIYSPPGYTNSTDGSTAGPPCIFRFGEADTSGPPNPTSDDVALTYNFARNIGIFSGDAIGGDIDNSGSTTGVGMVTASEDGIAHILCLVPNGGTLIRYTTTQN